MCASNSGVCVCLQVSDLGSSGSMDSYLMPFAAGYCVQGDYVSLYDNESEIRNSNSMYYAFIPCKCTKKKSHVSYLIYFIPE